MNNTQTYTLAGIPCKFINYRTNTLSNNWCWKLDPYLAEQSLPTSEHQPHNLIQSAGEATKLPPIVISEQLTKQLYDNETFDHSTLIAEEQSGFFYHRLYDLGNDNYKMQYEDGKTPEPLISFGMNIKENHITLLADNTATGGTLAIEYLGRVLVPFLLQYNLLTFHGVLMEYQGRGIILSAPSGTGKTTHARLWRNYKNALILNGDRASVKKEQGIWTGFGLPWSGTSGEQINRKVPLKAFVLLERGTENTAQHLEGLAAFEAMLTHLQVPAWHQPLSEKAIDLVLSMANEVPVIRLSCRPDPESVDVLLNELF